MNPWRRHGPCALRREFSPQVRACRAELFAVLYPARATLGGGCVESLLLACSVSNQGKEKHTPMSIKRKLRTYLWKLGYDISKITPTSHAAARKKQIFASYKIDTVLDIGANSGQFAQQLRGDIGYVHRILSFEPLSTAFELLKENSKDDPAWEVFNYAIGDTVEKQEINVAGNSYSSSLLDMLPSLLEFAPSAKYIGKEIIEIKTLDSLFDDLCKTGNNIYMKIDTQGFENKVLKGSENSLTHIDTVQMEMSLIPLYDGELLFNEMCILMSKKGYTLVAIENGFSDPTSGQLLQVDGIFHRL
jgi:FkbM family methyltransferase